jgi:hypothetical protein
MKFFKTIGPRVFDTFNIPVNGMNEYELYLDWIPKLHKKNLQTKIHRWIQQMLHQAFIPAPHQTKWKL